MTFMPFGASATPAGNSLKVTFIAVDKPAASIPWELVFAVLYRAFDKVIRTDL